MDSLEVMILGIQKYQFTDRNTGNQVSGTTVHYVQLVDDNSEDRKGYTPTKATLPYDYFEVLKDYTFPVTAQASITFDLANKRNPVKVTGFSVGDSVAIK